MLRTRIDGAVCDLHVLGPRSNQAAMHTAEHMLAVRQANGWNWCKEIIETAFNRCLGTRNVASAQIATLKVILPRQSSQPVNSLKLVQEIRVPVLWVPAGL
jgi:hypothetical protein